MKGLLIKDFKLFKNQYQFFLMILIVAILLSFSSNVEFMIGYLSIIGTLFTLSTISYDEYNNGYHFCLLYQSIKKGMLLKNMSLV